MLLQGYVVQITIHGDFYFKFITLFPIHDALHNGEKGRTYFIRAL